MRRMRVRIVGSLTEAIARTTAHGPACASEEERAYLPGGYDRGYGADVLLESTSAETLDGVRNHSWRARHRLPRRGRR
jgi:hypothetical protein